MGKESSLFTITVHKQPRPRSVHLLTLPSELLIQEILCCLPIPSLIACCQTCRFLNTLILSSSLLTYLKELMITGMLHNPLCPYTSYPISKRVDMLRERERRWRCLDPKWRRQLRISPPQDRYHIYDVIPGHVLFGVKKLGVAGAVSSLRLPNQVEGEAVWEEVADVGQNILNFGVALEEHDLIACLTCTNHQNRSNFQVHLLHHSTAEYHSSACVPGITVPTPHLQPGDVSADIAVCGENLAVSLKYPITPDPPTFINRLYLWNWKSGVLKAELKLDSRYYNPGLSTPGLTFLREDILLNPNSLVNSLDVYYIPYSHDSPYISGSSMHMVTRFKLPRLSQHFHHYFIQSHLSPSSSSSSLPPHLSRDKPFFNNPERSILGLAFDLYYDQEWLNFFLLVRWQCLLARSLQSLAEMNKSVVPLKPNRIYDWDEWGPHNSRLFPVPYNPVFVMTTTGSRWVCLADNVVRTSRDGQAAFHRKIEVYDFDETRIRLAAQRTITLKHKGRSTRVVQLGPEDVNDAVDTGAYPHLRIELVDATSPSVYTTSNGVFAEKVYTHLPYLRTIYVKPASGGGRFKKKHKKLTEWVKQKFRDRKSKVPDGTDANADHAEPAGMPLPRPDLCRWDGILIDDERITGITFERTGEEGHCRELDVLYLG